MTQFSMLNELSVLNGQVTQLAQADAITQAAGLLGREVTLTDQTGTSMTGVVDRVRRADSEIELSIDGSWWPLSSVTAVADGPAAAPTP
jgi:flagellar hook assembly protein FlgD